MGDKVLNSCAYCLDSEGEAVLVTGILVKQSVWDEASVVRLRERADRDSVRLGECDVSAMPFLWYGRRSLRQLRKDSCVIRY